MDFCTDAEIVSESYNGSGDHHAKGRRHDQSKPGAVQDREEDKIANAAKHGSGKKVLPRKIIAKQQKVRW